MYEVDAKSRAPMGPTQELARDLLRESIRDIATVRVSTEVCLPYKPGTL